MKLQEIKPIQQLKPMPDPLIDLSEMFDSTIDVVWKIDYDTEETTIEIGEFTYKIYLKSYRILKKIGFGISFAQIINNDETGEITNNTTNTSKILGIIYNAVKKQLLHYNADFVFFSAINSIPKRMAIYNSMVWLMKKFLEGFSLYKSIPYKNLQYTLIINRSIDFKLFKPEFEKSILDTL